MKDPHILVTTQDLDAYVDGQLAPERAAAVDVRLRGDPASLSQVFSLARINAALRRLKSAIYADHSLRKEVAFLLEDRRPDRAMAI